MINRITCIFFLLFLTTSFSQVSFEKTVLINNDDYSEVILGTVAEDINNDGYPDIVVSSSSDKKILCYKNITGNILEERPFLVGSNINVPKDIKVSDVDNDGLKDIVCVSQFDNTVFWYKNLGNFNFSAQIVIASSLNMPVALAVNDINNDGLNDIVVGLHYGQSVIYYLNAGNGNFGQSTTLFTTDESIKVIKVIDINNDGMADITSLQDLGKITCSINLGNGIFGPKFFIGQAESTSSSYDFTHLNEDQFPDLVYIRTSKPAYNINFDGQNFGTPEFIDTTTDNYRNVICRDIDNNGSIDLVVNSSSGLKWYKRTSLYGFGTSITISNNLVNSRTLTASDINADGKIDLLISSSDRLSLFSRAGASPQFSQIYLDLSLFSSRGCRIFDVDNDGLNDIVSGYRMITWNKNNGNGTFEAPRFINPEETTTLATVLEIGDLNNDNLIDIVAIKPTKLEVFKNLGNGNFSLQYTLPLTIQIRDIEIDDMNGDGKKDLVITFISGTTRLGVLYNNDNLNFNAIMPITYNQYYYLPIHIDTADIDNDGDIDIIVSSEDRAAIQFLRNNGTGTFAYNLVANSISTDAIVVADLYNDNYPDIITARSINSVGAVRVINNIGGVFSTPQTIDSPQNFMNLACGDINNDGVLDIVGVTVDDSNDRLIAYLSSGATFVKTILDDPIDSQGSDANVTVGHLTSDDKVDIVYNRYFLGETNYLTNTSALSNDEAYKNDSGIIFYPNPTLNKTTWDARLTGYDIEIHNEIGQAIFSKTNYSPNYFDFEKYPAGIYFVKLKSNNKVISAKVIKK